MRKPQKFLEKKAVWSVPTPSEMEIIAGKSRTDEKPKWEYSKIKQTLIEAKKAPPGF